MKFPTSCLFPVCPVLSHSVLSDSLWPRRLQPTRLLCPWDSPGKNPGVGRHALLQGIFPTQGSNSGLSRGRWILYHLSHQGSPWILGLLHGIFPAQELNLGLCIAAGSLPAELPAKPLPQSMGLQKSQKGLSDWVCTHAQVRSPVKRFTGEAPGGSQVQELLCLWGWGASTSLYVSSCVYAQMPPCARAAIFVG